MIADATIPVEPARMKPVRMFAVVDRGGALISCKRRKIDAIDEVRFGTRLTWRQWKRKYGLRVVRVIVKEIDRP